LSGEGVCWQLQSPEGQAPPLSGVVDLYSSALKNSRY
jgi:hypothetical protein